MKKITSCRLCGGKGFTFILSLGVQSLTGIFCTKPKEVLKAPLELIRCEKCELVQLAHHQDPFLLYGRHYGYRSGLNKSMVKHLSYWASRLMTEKFLEPKDLVIDIGSNDGTFLGFFPTQCELLGVDPTAIKFQKHYKPHIRILPEFFWSETVLERTEGRKAKLISSIAMLYDLQDPLEFAKEVGSCLEPDGIWFFEQSYLPMMLQRDAYDTICHEHLEYYSLKQLQILVKEAGLVILDLEMTETNGGSLAVIAGHGKECTEKLLEFEKNEKLLFETDIFQRFAFNALKQANDLQNLLLSLKAKGKKVLGYGASTKGNVVLQYAQVTPELVPAILDVNQDKYGSFTPGTGIKIVSEDDGYALKPDYLLVLPWHFRESIIDRERVFLERGGKLIFPLPTLEIVGSDKIVSGGKS